MALAPDSRDRGLPPASANLLRTSLQRGPSASGQAFAPERLANFNRALRALAPTNAPLATDDFAAVMRQLVHAHADGTTPPFIASRMRALARLHDVHADPAWDASPTLRHHLAVLDAYRRSHDDLIPDAEPVVGLLDDAVLVDVALQAVRRELADYQAFCRFRRLAADFAGIEESATGLTRDHWRGQGSGQARAPDALASLFQAL